MENNSWKIVRTRLKFTRIHIFPHDLYMLFVLSDYFALIISKLKFGGTTLSTFYNRNFIFISKHKDKIDTIRKKFLILITGWPSKKIFFESKGLIPLIWSSLYVQDNDGLRLILITNERQKNRTDRLLRVNSRLEKGEKKKKNRKEKEGYTRFQRIRNFRIETISRQDTNHIFRKFRGQMTRNEGTSVKRHQC